MSNLKLILPYFKKHFFMVLGGFFALIICDLAQLGIPKILGEAIDSLSSKTVSQSSLINPVLKILFLAFIVASMRYGWRTLIIGFSRTVEKGLRDRLYEKIVSLSPRWHMENSSGNLMAMATNDMDSVRMAISAGLISIVDVLVMGCAALGFMIAISPSMTLWALLPMPAITIMTHFLGRRIYNMVLEVQNIFGGLTEVVREQLSGLKVIRSMGISHLALDEADAAGRTYMEKNIKMSVLSGTFFPFLHFMSNFAVALILYFGGRESIMGQVSTGDFVAFINYMAMLTWPLMAMGMIIGFIQQGLASLSRLNRVFTAVEEDGRAIGLKAPKIDKASIEAVDLSFTYPERDVAALNSVNLCLPHDKITALIGPMGSGKSTLTSLLLGLYQAPPKSLKIGGVFVEDWPLADLRALFGYVPQDGFMFTGSIRENLCFGCPDATENEALAAASTAGLSEDIISFPDGLETIVGEKGLTLSGGQRQRLALARALLMKPAYLIMDDTLSAVDAAVEDGIMKRLLLERKGRGTLIISHRLSSLMEVDHIVVMDQGCVIDRGSPGELMERDSYLKRVCEIGQIAVAPQGDGNE